MNFLLYCRNLKKKAVFTLHSCKLMFYLPRWISADRLEESHECVFVPNDDQREAVTTDVAAEITAQDSVGKIGS